jgi:hypothetical protein
MSKLDWNEPTKIYMFRRGLREEVKDLLVGKNHSQRFVDYVKECIRLDNEWNARQEEKKAKRNAFPILSLQPSHAYQRAPSPDPLAGTTPMELDGTRRQITPTEKARRRAQGLCLYCGLSGHFAASCPQKRAPRAARMIAATRDRPQEEVAAQIPKNEVPQE